MAFSHGSKAVLKVADSGDVLTDLSAYLTDAGLPRDVDTAEVTTFGNVSKKFISGLSSATIPLQGPWDPTVDGKLAGILQMDDQQWEYYPAGLGTGNVKYSGVGLLSKYEVHTPIGGEATFSAEIQVSGTVTRAVL